MADPTTTAADPDTPGRPPASPGLRRALLAYRIAAWVVGTGLVVLVFVGIPLQVWGDNPTVAEVVGIAHGYLFMAYCVIVVVLAVTARWSLKRTAGVVLAGTVPLLGLFIERWVSHRTDVRQ